MGLCKFHVTLDLLPSIVKYLSMIPLLSSSHFAFMATWFNVQRLLTFSHMFILSFLLHSIVITSFSWVLSLFIKVIIICNLYFFFFFQFSNERILIINYFFTFIVSSPPPFLKGDGLSQKWPKEDNKKISDKKGG